MTNDNLFVYGKRDLLELSDKNTMRGKNEGFHIVKAGGSCNYHYKINVVTLRIVRFAIHNSDLFLIHFVIA